MANFGRRLGVNIYILMRKMNVSPEMFAERMGYTIKDVYNILEGKVLVAPKEIDKIIDFFKVTKEELFVDNADMSIPELQYMDTFSNQENLDKVLDLIDEYVELKEAI